MVTIRTFEWMHILIHINHHHISQVSKELNISMPHAYNVAKEFIDRGWAIKLVKKRRCRKYQLTESGERMRLIVIDLLKGLGEKNVERPLKLMNDNIDIFTFVRGVRNETNNKTDVANVCK